MTAPHAPRLTAEGWTTHPMDFRADEFERDYRARHGFEHRLLLGSWLDVEIALSGRDDADPAYLISITSLTGADGGHVTQLVFADRLPDALDLMARWAPLVTAHATGKSADALMYGGIDGGTVEIR